MIYCLIGHRGTGKTSLLRRLKEYFPQILTVDLDQFIEQESGLSISQIFNEQGEDAFRKMEEECFYKIVEATEPAAQAVICLGAGFQFELPEPFFRIQVGRASDSDARLFSNRPRLNSELSASQEYLERYKKREAFYASLRDYYFELPEGFDFKTEAEKQIWSCLLGFTKERVENTVYVLSQFEMDKLLSQENFIFKIQNYPNPFFELRTDFCNDKIRLGQLIQGLGSSRAFVSIREKNSAEEIIQSLPEEVLFDFDCRTVELKQHNDIFIASHHPTKGTSFEDARSELEEYAGAFPNALQKIAFYPNSLEDLNAAIHWQKEGGGRRLLFPISDSGEYSSLRLLLSKNQKINFVKNAYINEFNDQFSICFGALASDKNIDHAVIGDPIDHSRSPAIQWAYLSSRNSFMLKLKMNEDEFPEKLKFWNSQGVKNFAVTSPLKLSAFELCDDLGEDAKLISSVNTLAITDSIIYGENTDLIGFRQWMEALNIDASQCIVWGGGGTLKMMRSVLADASFYSARTASPREFSKEAKSAKVMIIAIQNSDLEKGAKKPEVFSGLEKVIDLGYKEDSFAKEWALENKLEYINGLEFLTLQGLAQRKVWK